MSKPRAGYRTLFAEVPEAVWLALDAEAAARGASIARVLTDLLARRYKVPPDRLPRPGRRGRPPRQTPLPG